MRSPFPVKVALLVAMRISRSTSTSLHDVDVDREIRITTWLNRKGQP